MNKGITLFNFDGLGEPAKALIEKIASGAHIIFEPTQIERKAKAEAKAHKIKELNTVEVAIEISEIQQRAMTRFIVEEGKKQENIEKITTQALNGLNEDAKPGDIDDDWITNFFDKCRLVSDEEMQSLWGSLLSGEANKPGSFTKRTVGLVATLDKKDAHLFTIFCGFCCQRPEFTPLIHNEKEEIYRRNGINFNTLNHLDDIGLIKFIAGGGYCTEKHLSKVPISYFKTQIIIKFQNEENNDLRVGKVLFTKTGEELASICGAKEVDGFLDYIIEKWKNLGYKVAIPEST